MKQSWYEKSATQVLREFETNKKGLSETESRKRLKKAGQNILPEPPIDGLFTVFLRQFKSPLIYLLLSASVIVYFIGEFTDSVTIIIVLTINAIIGTIQEGRAQKALSALKRFTSTKAVVLRDNKEILLSDTEVVPGDIIILHEGDKIPADSRIILNNSLFIDESSLTGESEPVQKTLETIRGQNLVVGDQKNMVFKGSHITSGGGQAVVVATGLNTEIGKISATILNINTEDPIKKDIGKLSKQIVVVAAVISLIILLIGVWRDMSVLELVATVISLSVSIIPEGLPIVITLVLATGVWRMSKQNALVKKLQAVESLGQAQIIAVDKTGTITKNEMTVQKVFVDGKIYDISGTGYEPNGHVTLNKEQVHLSKNSPLMLTAKYAAYCANARANLNEAENKWEITGDPTEAAMLVFAEKLGIFKDALEKNSPLLAELPFSSKTKYHATLHQEDNRNLLVAIGAPEVMLESSSKYLNTGSFEDLNTQTKQKIHKAIENFSKQGLRVLGIAIQEPPQNKSIAIDDIQKLNFVGLFGIKDGLREGVRESIKLAQDSGIKVVMITGDHIITAKAIAEEAGIYKNGDTIITGTELEGLSTKQLSQKLNKVSVFARVSPEHKLKIIESYQLRKNIIAMTGDGVNDAPSLVAADLGVAMGVVGTEVAKEASDIVLLDDNFRSIVLAIEEGRNIYKTIKKVILYLFSTGLGEALAIAAAIAVGLPIPVSPSQIIWLNFVTDGFLVVALGMEPKERGLLDKNFTKNKNQLLDWLMFRRILIMGSVMAIGTLILFNKYLGLEPRIAGTMALTTLAIFQWFNAFNSRSETKSIFTMNPFSNLYLVGAFTIVVLLQIFAVYSPIMHTFLKTQPLTLREWLLCIIVASSIFVVEEIRKAVYSISSRIKL